MEIELIETREEMKGLVVESRKAEVEGASVSTEAVSKTHSAEEEAGFDVSEQRCLGELGVSVMSSAGGSQNKAAVWKESAETQKYESCQQNDMEVDKDENTVEMSFVASAVSDSAGWHEPSFMCDRQCGKEVCKFYGIASIMVEDTESRTQYTFA